MTTQTLQRGGLSECPLTWRLWLWAAKMELCGSTRSTFHQSVSSSPVCSAMRRSGYPISSSPTIRWSWAPMTMASTYMISWRVTSRRDAGHWRSIHLTLPTSMCLVTVASCSPHAVPMSCCSGICPQGSRSLLEPVCWEMSDGRRGRATWAGRCRESTPSAPMALSSTQWIAPTSASTTLATKMKSNQSIKASSCWRQAMTTGNWPSTTTRPPSRVQVSWNAGATLATWPTSDGTMTTAISCQWAVKTNVSCTGESTRTPNEQSNSYSHSLLTCFSNKIYIRYLWTSKWEHKTRTGSDSPRGGDSPSLMGLTSLALLATMPVLLATMPVLLATLPGLLITPLSSKKIVQLLSSSSWAYWH